MYSSGITLAAQRTGNCVLMSITKGLKYYLKNVLEKKLAQSIDAMFTGSRSLSLQALLKYSWYSDESGISKHIEDMRAYRYGLKIDIGLCMKRVLYGVWKYVLLN